MTWPANPNCFPLNNVQELDFTAKAKGSCNQYPRCLQWHTVSPKVSDLHAMHLKAHRLLQQAAYTLSTSEDNCPCKKGLWQLWLPNASHVALSHRSKKPHTASCPALRVRVGLCIVCTQIISIQGEYCLQELWFYIHAQDYSADLLHKYLWISHVIVALSPVLQTPIIFLSHRYPGGHILSEDQTLSQQP